MCRHYSVYSVRKRQVRPCPGCSCWQKSRAGTNTSQTGGVMKQHEGGGKAAKYEFGKVIFNDQLSFQNNSSRIGGFRAKQTHKKSWLRRYRGKKRIRRKPAQRNLCLQKKNLCIIWGKPGTDSSILSVCCPRSYVRNQEQQTPFPRAALPAVVTLALLSAVQPNL